VRLAYKELADEAEMKRDPGKWRNREHFDVTQLVNRYPRPFPSSPPLLSHHLLVTMVVGGVR
jgi:hypothetical protein